MADLVWDGRQLAGGVKAHERTNERTVAESITPGRPGQRCWRPGNWRSTRWNTDGLHLTAPVPLSCLLRYAHLSNLANLYTDTSPATASICDSVIHSFIHIRFMSHDRTHSIQWAYKATFRIFPPLVQNFESLNYSTAKKIFDLPSVINQICYRNKRSNNQHNKHDNSLLRKSEDFAVSDSFSSADSICKTHDMILQ